MAWVRPKHPPPKKQKPDPVVTLLPMLSYFSSSRPPPPLSPTKPKHQTAPVLPLLRDPILQNFQQSQARHHDAPTYHDSEDEEPSINHQLPTQRRSPSRYHDVEERHEASSQCAHTVRQYHREPSPPPPPPLPPPQPLAQPLAQPRPRVASYERAQPVNVVRERYVPRSTNYLSYGERMASRATSAKWASATAPLDIR